MDTLSQYSQILRLKSSGTIEPKNCPDAYNYLVTQYTEFSELATNQDHQNLQILLKQELGHYSMIAALCLRCYVSGIILFVCQNIVRRYKQRYGIQLVEIASILLTDDGTLNLDIKRVDDKLSIHTPNVQHKHQNDRFQPLSYKVLEKFDPQQSTLSHWTTRITRQSPELRDFLKKEYNILLISHWALLNSTTPKALKGILTRYFNFSETHPQPLNEALSVLSVYRSVYLSSYQNRRKALCPDPTRQQYWQMTELLTDDFFRSCLKNLDLPTDNPKLANDVILNAKIDYIQERVFQIAMILRNHRLKIYPAIEVATSSQSDSDDSEAFAPFLKKAIRSIIQNRLNNSHIPQKNRDNFLTILHLTYVENKTQEEIANTLGLTDQTNVAKLLNMTKLTSGLACHMLTHLKNDVPTIAVACQNPDQLLKVQTSIADYAQKIMSEDKKWRHTSPNRRGQSNQFRQFIVEILASDYPQSRSH